MAPHVQNTTSIPAARETSAPAKTTVVSGPRREPSAVGAFAKALSWEIRRLRTRFTRDNIIAFLKTMRWVLPLTILAWVYALSEQETHTSGIAVPIEVKSNDPHKIVTLVKDHSIICDLSGPRSSLERFTQSNSTSVKPIVITIDAANLQDGDNSIPTLQSLEQNKRFSEAGISLAGVIPPSLLVNVDELKTATLPVQKPDVSTLESATFTPRAVEVSGPKSVVDHMTAITADLSSVSIPNTPGARTVNNIPLVQPDPEHPLNYSPSTVNATLVVKAADVTREIADVRVYVSVPPILLQSHDISPSQNTIPKITVVGPPDQINKLVPTGDIAPTAIFIVNGDNINTPGQVPVTITGLPDGVRLVGPTPQISFTVTDRTPH
jgi:hypothetical protein